MALPTLTGGLDKTNYAIGDTAKLTLTVTDPDRGTLQVTGTYTDSSGNVTTVDASATVDVGTFAVQSNPAKQWTKQSDANGTAVFTTVV